MNRTLLFVCLCGLTWNVTLLAQVQVPGVASQAKTLDRMHVVISRALGGPATAALAADRKVMEQAHFKLGGNTSPAEAEQLAAWSWFWLRVGAQAVPLNQPLDLAIIQRKSDNLAKMAVRSNPNAAAITVDGKLMGDTDTDVFVEAGQRSVRVEKQGYAAAQQSCSVKAKTLMTFSAVMGAKLSSAECK